MTFSMFSHSICLSARRMCMLVSAAATLPNVGDMTALKEAEIKNGRAAMMAITGFAVQEFIWGTPVVAQTPLFF